MADPFDRYFDGSRWAAYRRLRGLVKQLRKEYLPETRIRSALFGAPDDGGSASERTAHLLRAELIRVRHLQNEGKAPGRNKILLPEKTIADIAMTMVEVREPGPHLIQLLMELLKVDQHRSSKDANPTKRERAEVIQALATKKLGVTELAREVDVSAGTVTRWNRDEEFGNRIKEHKENFKKMGPIRNLEDFLKI